MDIGATVAAFTATKQTLLGMFVDECMACLRYSILSRSPLILRCHITVPGLLESFWIRALSSTCESFGIFPAGNSVVSFGLLRLVMFG